MQTAVALVRDIGNARDMVKTAMEESADTAIYRKKLAVVQGELEGYSCKVEGFKRALGELELQLAEKDLQVAMLKSVIVDADNPAALEFRLIEALEENQQLQQQLHKVTGQLAAAHAAAAAATPRSAQHHRRRWHDSAPNSCSDDQQVNCQSTQLLMLRKALTAANMRLTSNGLLPVAATSELLQAQDLIDSWPGDQGIAFASYTPAHTASAAAAAPTPCSNTSERLASPTPYLPALCLFSKLSAVFEDGTSTPLSGGPRLLQNSSRCTTPDDTPTPSRVSNDGSSTQEAATDAAVDAACIVVASVSSVRSPFSRSVGAKSLVMDAGVPAAALRACTWRRKGPGDYSSNTDDESHCGSDLSDDYDAGQVGVYPLENEGYSAENAGMQTPVLDNPLFLHNRPECSR